MGVHENNSDTRLPGKSPLNLSNMRPSATRSRLPCTHQIQTNPVFTDSAFMQRCKMTPHMNWGKLSGEAAKRKENNKSLLQLATEEWSSEIMWCS